MLKWVTGRASYKPPTVETVVDFSGDESPPSATQKRRRSRDREDRHRERRRPEKEAEIKSTVSGRSSKSSHTSRRSTEDEMSREDKERRRKERAERRSKDSASSVTSESTSVSRVSRRSGQMVVKLPDELPIAPLPVEPLVVTGRKRSPTMPTNLRSMANEERDPCSALPGAEKSRLITKRASDTALHTAAKIDGCSVSTLSQRDDILSSPLLQSTSSPTLSTIPASVGLAPLCESPTSSPGLPYPHPLPPNTPATPPHTPGSKPPMQAQETRQNLPPTPITEVDLLKHSDSFSDDRVRRTHKSHIRSNSEVRFASSVTDGTGTPRSGFKYPSYPHYPEQEYFPSQPLPKEHYHQESTGGNHKAELPPRPEFVYWPQQRPQSAAGYYGYHQQAYPLYPQNYPPSQQSAVIGPQNSAESVRIQPSNRENSGRSVHRHSLPPQTSHHDYYTNVYPQYQMQPFTPQPPTQPLVHHVPRYPPPPLPPSADVEAVAHKRPERKRRHSVHYPSSYEPSYYQFQRGLTPTESNPSASKLPYEFPPPSRRAQPTRLSLSSKKSYRPPAPPEFTSGGLRNFFMSIKPEEDEQREEYAPEAFENETTVTSMVAVSSGYPTREARLPVGRLVRKRPSGDKEMNPGMGTTLAGVVEDVPLPISLAPEPLSRPVLPPVGYCAAMSVFEDDDIEGREMEGVTKHGKGDRCQWKDVTAVPLPESVHALSVRAGIFQEEVEEVPAETGQVVEEEGPEEAKDIEEQNSEVEMRDEVDYSEEEEEDRRTVVPVDQNSEGESLDVSTSMVRVEDYIEGGVFFNGIEIDQEEQTPDEQEDNREEDEKGEEDDEEVEDEDQKEQEEEEVVDEEQLAGTDDEEPDDQDNPNYSFNLAYSTHVESDIGVNLEEQHDQTQEEFLANLDSSSAPPSSIFSTTSEAPTVITADLDSIYPSTAEASATHAATTLSTTSPDFSSNVSTTSGSYASSHPNQFTHAPFSFVSPTDGAYTPSTGSSATSRYPIRNPMYPRQASPLTELTSGSVMSDLYQRVPIPPASLSVTAPQTFPRFTNLNLRLLRHLEAELVELERMLEACESQIENNGSESRDGSQQYYDNMQAHASSKEYTYSPAGSLRSMLSCGSSNGDHPELRSKHAELIDALAWKLGQYSQALLNYRNMVETFEPPMKPCSTRRPGSRDSGVASSRGSSGVRLPQHSVSEYGFENASSDRIPGEWCKLVSELPKKLASEDTIEEGGGSHKNEHPVAFGASSHQVQDTITGSRSNSPTQEQPPKMSPSDGCDSARSVRSSSLATPLFPSLQTAMTRLPNQIFEKLQSIRVPPPALFQAASIATCVLALVCVMSWGWLVVFCVIGGLGLGLNDNWFNTIAPRLSIELEMQEVEREEEEQRGRSGRPSSPDFVVGPAENSERFPGAFPA